MKRISQAQKKGFSEGRTGSKTLRTCGEQRSEQRRSRVRLGGLEVGICAFCLCVHDYFGYFLVECNYC